MYDPKRMDELYHWLRRLADDMICQMVPGRTMRDVVHELRSIATELDCLKPVDATDFVTAQNMHSFGDLNPPIPAAPGPDYATQKQLDTTRISLVNMIHASRDEFLALVGRVERIEMALAPRPDNDCRSGVAMKELDR